MEARHDDSPVLGRFASREGDLVPVRLLGFPLRLFARAREHHDELMRELALMSMVATRREDPARLVELVDVLGRRYGAASYRGDPAREEALARGDLVADLTYDLPLGAAEACVELGELMDSADAFCRSENLLTLETPPDEVAFRRWYLAEIVTQLHGGTASPWTGPLS